MESIQETSLPGKHLIHDLVGYYLLKILFKNDKNDKKYYYLLLKYKVQRIKMIIRFKIYQTKPTIKHYFLSM